MSCSSNATPQVGSIGEELDLLIAQGRTFGPLSFEMATINPDLLPWPADTDIPDSAWIPFDLTGCEIRGQMRKKWDSTAAEADFVCTITDATAGKYEIDLPDEVTADIIAGSDYRRPESQYVWDLELVDSAGDITPLYWGAVRVQRRVTRV